MANEVRDNRLHRIAMTCVIYNEAGKFLAVKRADNQKVHPGKWTVPGGGLEPSDYADIPKTTNDAWYGVVEKALRREVTEEVGVEIGQPKLLTDIIFIRPDDIPVLVLSYYAPYVSGEVVLDEEELTEYRWVTPGECIELDFISGIADEIDETAALIANESREGRFEERLFKAHNL